MTESATEHDASADSTANAGVGESPDDGAATPDPTEALGRALAALAEAGTYGREWVSAKVDGVLFGVRKLALLAVLGAVAGLVGVTFVIMSTVLLLLGISSAISAALPAGFAWVGPLVVGLIGVVLSVGGLWLVLKMVARAGRRSAIEGYRRKLLAQHRKFGTDAYSRAVARAARETPRGPKPANEAVESETAARLRQDLDVLRETTRGR